MVLRSGVRGELITITSGSGLLLDGLLFEVPNAVAIVVHVHGSYGNFFQAPFLRTLIRRYLDQKISVLAVNTSGHDGFGEGYFVNGEFAYVGGAVSDFRSCVPDIGAMVEFAAGLGGRVILQGHSLGCDRVLYYSLERQATNDIVLLAPCDSYALHCRWLGVETIQHQVDRLRREAREVDPDWLEQSEYGIRQGPGWEYNLPVARRAFLSIADGPPFKLINLRTPAAFGLPVSAAIYLGGRDALQTSPSEAIFDYFSSRLKSVLRIFDEQGDHMLAGCDTRVADKLAQWIRFGE
jgi:hypothetical protein